MAQIQFSYRTFSPDSTDRPDKPPKVVSLESDWQWKNVLFVGPGCHVPQSSQKWECTPSVLLSQLRLLSTTKYSFSLVPRGTYAGTSSHVAVSTLTISCTVRNRGFCAGPAYRPRLCPVALPIHQTPRYRHRRRQFWWMNLK